jgi:hypothetical protein
MGLKAGTIRREEMLTLMPRAHEGMPYLAGEQQKPSA